MNKRLFLIVMYTDFNRTRIGYCGLFPNKQEILKRIPILNYNDLVYKEKKYKTCKSLFDCIEIPSNKKHYFSSYHLSDYKRSIRH
jgi:hypothetical protein